MGSNERNAPAEMSSAEFKELGHKLVDTVAGFLESLRERPVALAPTPKEIQEVLGAKAGLPAEGSAAGPILDRAAQLLFDYSCFNGHPRWWGYITSSAAPIGALADMLAAAVNPNTGGFSLAPIATEIEAQAVRWIAELIGFPAGDGLFVSGGNMANMTAVWTARTVKCGWDMREDGLYGGPQLKAYGAKTTHTWIQKSMDLSGFGNKAFRGIETDGQDRIDPDALRKAIEEDKKAGHKPFLVIGNAGTVATGAVDPLPELAKICKEHDLWFHVDGAYGAFAAATADASEDLRGLSEADSVACDPHKWLYSALEAGCVLVRERGKLVSTFSYHPSYYMLYDQEYAPIYYSALGPQNSRGFRALRVWVALQQTGREGAVKMMEDDCALAQKLYDDLDKRPEFEVATRQLSITTFRYVPEGLEPGSEEVEKYLNELNSKILEKSQATGEAFITNAVLNDKFLLRTCIVNFRTTEDDILSVGPLIERVGRELDQEMRPAELKS